MRIRRLVLMAVILMMVLGLAQPAQAQSEREYKLYKVVMTAVFNLGDGSVYEDNHLRIEREIVQVIPSPGPGSYERVRVYWHNELVAEFINAELVTLKRGRWMPYARKLVKDLM